MDMPITIIDAPVMTEELDVIIRRNLCICFPNDREVFSKTRAWHGCLADWTVIIEDQNDVIAHLGVIERTVRVADSPIRTAGIQNVFTLPDFRGRGYVDTILSAAMDHARSLGFDFGILFCAPQLEKTYLRNSWITLDNPQITYLDDNGRPTLWDTRDPMMIYPLTDHPWPKGPIDLQGPAM